MSARLGCVLGTIARWETVTQPPSAALTVLRDWAQEREYSDLADVFSKALERRTRTEPVLVQKAREEQLKWAQLDVLLSEIQGAAERLKDQGSPDGKRIYDLANDMWQALDQIHLTSWRSK
jgi:hypothetical protein